MKRHLARSLSRRLYLSQPLPALIFSPKNDTFKLMVALLVNRQVFDGILTRIVSYKCQRILDKVLF